MKNKQSAPTKFLTLSLLLFSSCLCLHAQNLSFRLKTADSLFVAKRYTQSLEHYQEILKQNQFTPAMLLKMSFIEEGLGNTGQALYYLNLYANISHDRSTWEKMEELAEKNDLQGYAVANLGLFQRFPDLHLYIAGALAAILCLFLALAVAQKRRGTRPVAAVVVATIIGICFALFINFGGVNGEAIIVTDETYVMDGPSGAATLIEIVKDGHRVEILGKKDVWVRILWDGHEAWVRESALKPVAI